MGKYHLHDYYDLPGNKKVLGCGYGWAYRIIPNPGEKKKILNFEILIENDNDIDKNLNFARCSDRGGLRPTLTFRRRLEAELAFKLISTLHSPLIIITSISS